MQKPQKLRPFNTDDTTRSVDMLWDGIQNRYEQVKASNDGRLNLYKDTLEDPASAGSFSITQDTTIINKPGNHAGLGCVPAKQESSSEMPAKSGHLPCTEEPLTSLQQRAQKIIEKNQRQRQESLMRAAELFMAGPEAWPDYPNYEDVEFEDDEPLWEPLPPKP